MSAVTDGIVRSIDQCMLIDRHKFKSRLKRSKSSQALDQLKSLIEQSKSLALSRQQEVSVEYPDSLPITQRVEDIKGCVRDHPVVIVAGETGSGKTTQLPKLLLDMGFGVYGAIGHTQPRRIAARSVANRISEELGSTLGNLVGFKVRFDDVTSPASRIKLMTDGILLAELANDPYLNQYDCLVIDEAHERSLNIDFLLGYLKRLISKRRDLKVIITSATLNTERFSKHFDNAPIIEVSGRTYPVEIRYRSADALQGDTALDIEGAIKELMSEGRGDILVFLPGERDIKEVQKHLQQRKVDADLLPLFGRLSAGEQNRIFTNGGRRRVVLATNIAETSLTVPGIRYVVDPGVARISRYSYRTKVQRLPVEKISQASANQRAGRCGRVADGICIRLFDLEDYEARPEYTDPELLRTNLGSVILQMALLRLGDVESFPFVDPPDVKFVRDGYRLLQELKALGKNNRITTLGKKIARLPVDPRFGRMLIEAQTLGVLPSVRIIVAGLSVQDPRERPLEHAEQADQCHKVFQDEQSDFSTWLNLWNAFQQHRRDSSRKQFKAWCFDNFLSIQRLFEWSDVHQQLKVMQGAKGEASSDNAKNIHRALLTGLVSHFGVLSEGMDYDGPRGSKFRIFPGSGLAKRKPKWVMAGSLVETSRLFARTVATIRPEWLEKAGAHLVNRSYSDLHWSAKEGVVIASEQVSLYGIIIVGKRSVRFSQINPEEANPTFVQQALVLGRLGGRKLDFLSANIALRREIEEVENKQRRRSLLISDDHVAEFYLKRLPKQIATRLGLRQWLKQASKEQVDSLFMRSADLTGNENPVPQLDLFPDHFDLGGNQLRLEYQYDTNSEADGATLHTPLALLPQLDQIHLDYAIPGMLEQKLIALIKGLPKGLRKNFVPAPDFARACVDQWQGADLRLPLLPNLSETLEQMTGVRVSEEQWPSLPDHLRIRVSVRDAKGGAVSSGRDLSTLKESSPAESNATDFKTPGLVQEKGLKTWSFAPLPEQVVLNQGALKIRRYPAIFDERTHVDIGLCQSRADALATSRRGLQRLFVLALSQQSKSIVKGLSQDHELLLVYRGLGDIKDLADDIVCSVADQLFLYSGVSSKADFEASLSRGRSDFLTQADARCRLVKEILLLRSHAASWCNSHKDQPHFKEVIADIQRQLERLVFPGFVRGTPRKWLDRLPTYLKAIQRRQEKVGQALGKDEACQQEIDRLIQEMERQIRLHGAEKLAEIPWMIEEFRVSLFAQDLKTAMPISAKRIVKKLEATVTQVVPSQ